MQKANNREGWKVGFTLGKFAPLHKGHQYLIEQALEQVDHLILMIYGCPDLIDVSLERRAGWIQALYPQIEIILAPDGPMEIGDTPEIHRMHEDYIGHRLAGRSITHFFSSEFYGDHISRFLNAVDCRVDEARAMVPVSATMIRNDPFANRQWLHPLVYKDLIKKVVFLGAPSTGKTTLASELAARLNTCWMPEYGREYWEQHQVDRRLTPFQLLEIAEGHLVREEGLLEDSNGFLFVDTNALTTWHFARYYHGNALPELERMAEQSTDRYDIVFLCGDDIPYDDSWDRSGEVNRAQFQTEIEKELIKRKVQYTLLTGSLEDRVRQVLEKLGVNNSGHEADDE
ncbi:cytidyltransferase [Hahella sp. CCB-MM4]|uniref:AAA family ATPase n=1 Tax=Hahella sp. (strain CCB-MM4) TaxID=1926491 RepID=UPI000B9B8447|nr:AAA family ATPase [Hahella sp. CCB-MM4]OZG74189.1 cytidyltransferase [Hahella sp. CCB-MM4]